MLAALFRAALIHEMNTKFFSERFSLKQRKMYLNSSRDSSCSSDLQIDLTPPVSFISVSDGLFMYPDPPWCSPNPGAKMARYYLSDCSRSNTVV
jgi:hypothetical protein